MTATATMATTTMTPVLLFVHGTNFCKEIWRPIERHLKGLPLLRSMPDVHFASIDLPYHGSKRDDSVAAVVDEMTATVHHPASRFVTLNTEAVHREVQYLRTKFGSRLIVGVGHSMGAAALWNVEAKTPGTFCGLVFFEPFVEEPGTRDPKVQRYIFNLALKRQYRWDTRQAAVKYFENVKGFATWDRECLAGWLDGALIPEKKGSDAVVLACHPTIEAAIYCGERLWLSDSEMSRVSCPVAVHSSDNTWLFDPVFFADVEKKWSPVGKHDAQPHHGECAEAIHTLLKELDCIKPACAKL